MLCSVVSHFWLLSPVLDSADPDCWFLSECLAHSAVFAGICDRSAFFSKSKGPSSIGSMDSFSFPKDSVIVVFNEAREEANRFLVVLIADTMADSPVIAFGVAPFATGSVIFLQSDASVIKLLASSKT